MTLDLICSLARNAELLNALHACRPGHPLNKTMRFPWANAWALAAQRPAWEISCAATAWLAKQAQAERAAAR